MTTSTILSERRGQALWLTMDRPQAKNALDLPMVQALTTALASAGGPGGARVVVLRSAVKGYFSIGMDLSALQSGLAAGATSPRVYEVCREYVGLLKVMTSLRCPIIAAVEGMAVGGGVDLLSACDLAVAGDQSAFSVAQLRKGIFPLTTSGLVIPRIGQRQFLHWALTGQNWSARKALHMGLINEVVAAGTVEARATRLAEQICGFGEEALRLGIDALRQTPDLPLPERLDQLGQLLALNCQIPRGEKP